MNLSTIYLNLQLRSPLVVSASPLSHSIDQIRQMEDAGAGAVVLFSLFEEQMRLERQVSTYLQSNPRATQEHVQALYPERQHYRMDIAEYLEHIRKAKQAVHIPIIASINCTTVGSWIDYARQMEQSGADAIELNVYYIPTSAERTSEQIEAMIAQIVEIVKSTVSIPVAVKLVPFFTNIAALARRLDQVGADGIVLFNRFYQPDFDPHTLRIQTEIPLGNPGDNRLPLHWIGLLYGSVRADLAATSGIFTAQDVVKMLMVGAKVTMLASVLLTHGIDHLRVLESDLRRWMEENEYQSVEALQGMLPQFQNRDAGSFERNAYIRAISSTRPLV
jgi:dihydroorotate dehydrogenase (fumarate)